MSLALKLTIKHAYVKYELTHSLLFWPILAILNAKMARIGQAILTLKQVRIAVRVKESGIRPPSLTPILSKPTHTALGGCPHRSREPPPCTRNLWPVLQFLAGMAPPTDHEKRTSS